MCSKGPGLCGTSEYVPYAKFRERRKDEVRILGILQSSYARSWISPALLLPLGTRMLASRAVDSLYYLAPVRSFPSPSEPGLLFLMFALAPLTRRRKEEVSKLGPGFFLNVTTGQTVNLLEGRCSLALSIYEMVTGTRKARGGKEEKQWRRGSG
jgi:hypothetical protein